MTLSALKTLEEQWATETAKIPSATFGLNEVPWPQVLRSHLPGVLADLRVVMDNYQSTDRLSYPKDGPADDRRNRAETRSLVA